MKDRTPFTYLLKFKPTGQYYYGSRYCKGCHPEQLWKTYFTSSKIVCQLLKEHGAEAFEVKITKVFDNKESARKWEHRFLHKVKASKNAQWLNQHNGAGDFINKGGLKFSEEHLRKLSEAQRGKPKPGTSTSLMGNTRRKGKKFTPEQRERLSEARIGNKNRLGVKHSDEMKKIIAVRTSAALKGKKQKTIECPHCNKIGGVNNMTRYHFNNCKLFTSLPIGTCLK